MSDVHGVKFNELSKQSLCAFRYLNVTVAFKLLNKFALSPDAFLRLGDVLFCEREMSLKNSPIHDEGEPFSFRTIQFGAEKNCR